MTETVTVCARCEEQIHSRAGAPVCEACGWVHCRGAD